MRVGILYESWYFIWELVFYMRVDILYESLYFIWEMVFYMRVGILYESWYLTRIYSEKHLHDRIISLREVFWVHESSLTHPLLLKCKYQTLKV
jgi:hypothetical protein